MASELRYAHAEGQTWVAFEGDGRSLVTGGCDGDVRVYKDFEDDDPKSFRAGQQVYSMAVKKGCIATGLETNSVQLYTFQGRTDGLAARFEAPCYSIAFSHSGVHLAAAGGDFNIKVPLVASPSKTKVLSGHEAPILSLSFDATDDYLASASCDGSVRIWKLSEEKCVHTEKSLEKGNDISAVASICGLAWQPKTGELLAIPVKNTVQMLQRITWKVLYTLSCPEDDQIVNVVSWTPCGKFLAAGTIKGDIFLFDVAKKAAIENLENPSAICSMQFHPNGDSKLVFTDVQGQLGLWDDLPISQLSLALDVSGDDMADEDLAAMVMDTDMDAVAVGASAPKMVDESSNLSSASALPSTSKAKIRASFLDDSADESGSGSEDDDEAAVDAAAAADLAGDDFIVDGDNIADWDEDNLDERPVYQEPLGAQQRLLAQTINASEKLKEQRKALKSTVAKQQVAFQVGSTSKKQHTFFMAYNEVGMIRCKREEADLSMLDVEFHDTSIHHAMHISNTSEYDLAALSEEAVVFASTANGEGKNKLECRHFASWDGGKEWTTVMTKKEAITSLAVSSSFVAVTTTRNLLRVWTLTGVQSFLASLPGPVVTMVAFRDLLAVSYHHAIGGSHQQCISCQVYRYKDGVMRLLRTAQLPLAHKASLTWLGFSACGFLCMAESTGLVHMLLCQPSPLWLPITDLRNTLKAKEDTYWLVGIDDGIRQVRCIHCKDATFPPCNPRPILSILDYSPPLCELTTEKAQLELDYVRLHSTTTAAVSHPVYPVGDVELDECQREEAAALMKLFALSCKMDREARALDICRLMANEHMMSLAQRYASRMQRITLAQRIDDLMEDRALAAQDANDDEDVIDVDNDDYAGGTQAITSYDESQNGHRYRYSNGGSSSASTSSSRVSHSSMGASSLSSSASGSTVGQVRLQPRAQLMERHRQHRRSVAAQQSLSNGSVSGAAKAPVARADTTANAEAADSHVDNSEELTEDIGDDDWPAVDDGDDMSDAEDSQPSATVTTPKAKTPGKAYGGMATSNPFQLSGTGPSLDKTPTERGGSYLDKLSSTTPVGARKRKADSASPAAGSRSSASKVLREKNGSKSGGGGGKQKQVQASLVSSLTGKPSMLQKSATANDEAASTNAESGAAKGKRGRPKKGVKRSEEAGFSLWLAGAEGSLKDEYPHMTAAALRNEAMQRWGGLSNDEKESFVSEAKSSAKAKASALFGQVGTRKDDANAASGGRKPALGLPLGGIVPDSLEDNIVENSLDCTPAGDDDCTDLATSVGLGDENTCLSPPKRSRSARFLDSDDDDEENGHGSSPVPAKRAKLADASKDTIVAQSTKASLQKLAGFAFAK